MAATLGPAVKQWRCENESRFGNLSFPLRIEFCKQFVFCKKYTKSNLNIDSHNMSDSNHPLSQGSIEAFAGFVAGIASVQCPHGVQKRILIFKTLVAHPLDVIKTRLQGTSAALLPHTDTKW